MKKKLLKLSAQAQKEYDEIKRPYNQAYEFVEKARYKKAFELALDTYKKYPLNRFALFQYAALLGDNKEGISEAQHRRNHKTSARLLKGLLRRTSGLDPRHIKTFRNEYYWFSKQPYRQYRLGIEYAKKLGKKQLYSAGVGACMLSVNKYKKRQYSQGRQWAKKSILAWEEYFTASPKYYNSWAWYAQALGLTGDIEGMEKALKKAAKLANRSLYYEEFQEVRNDVAKLLGKQSGK